MRSIIYLVVFCSCFATQAQTGLPVSGMNALQNSAFNHSQLLNDSNRPEQKWFVSSYAGIGAGIGFFNRGSAVFLPGQMGVQINRRLNNNLYAFAGAGLTPVYFNFNRSFSNADPSKSYMLNSGFGNHGWGIYPGIQAGLMYVNDAKTFSISGSIGVSRSNHSFYPAGTTVQKQAPVAGSRQ